MAEGKRPYRPGSRPSRPGTGKPGATGVGPKGFGPKPFGPRPFASRPFASRPFGPKGPAAKGIGPINGRRPPAQAAPAAADPRGDRLQKVMAHAGVASRRHSEELIMAGRVTIDGQVVKELGTRVLPRQVVEVDGKPLQGPERHVYIVLNKPRGYVTTLFDPQGRATVATLIAGVPERVYPVGRLDFDTEGVLLFTNDGGLSHALAHPARLVKKTYLARVRGVPSAAKLRQLETGVELDDGPTAPAEAKLISAGKEDGIAVVSLTIHEGRNRQVKRMLEAVGHEVIGLRRIRLAGVGTEGLAPGQWRELTEEEIKTLYHHAGLKYGDEAAGKVTHGRTLAGGAARAPVRPGRRAPAFKGAAPAFKGAAPAFKGAAPAGRPPARGRAVGPAEPRTVRGMPVPKGRLGAGIEHTVSALRSLDREEQGAAPERRDRFRPAQAEGNPFVTKPLKRSERPDKPAAGGDRNPSRPARPGGFKPGPRPQREGGDIGLPRPAGAAGGQRPAGAGGAPRTAGPGGAPRTAGPGGAPRTAGPGGAPRTAGPGGAPRTARPGGAPRTAGPGGAPRTARPGGAPRTARPGGFKPAARPRPMVGGPGKGPGGPKPGRPRRPES